jgi:GTP-binding protein
MTAKATIAIVGRPNVGKSTLFNRLTGRRTALVSDLPGLTRDRKEGEASIGGHVVRLVDTAGLEEAPATTIQGRMRAQSETAIQTADLILFVVDARAGLTATDKAFARIVRTAGRPTVLVANKSEGRAGQEGIYETFELGLGEPVAISAEHGEGIGDLEVDMLAALGLEPVQRGSRRGGRARRDELEQAPVGDDADADIAGDIDGNGEEAADTGTHRPLRVAIVGRPNAGKSTLVNALLGEDRMITGPEPGLTRDSVASTFMWAGRRIELFDTAGLRRKARIHETAEKLAASDAVRAIRFAEVVVLLVDAERPLEHQDLTIGELVTEEGRALVVAVNKWDLVEAKQSALAKIRETVGEKLSQVEGVPVVPVSALGEHGLDKLMKAVLEAAEVWNRRVPTPALNRWLQEALTRHPPPAASGRRIRLRFATQPSTRPPTFVAFCSKPADLPGSYIRYLVRSLRQTFGLPGTPIRFNLRKGGNPYVDK